ncbi:PDR/VanB family oxidoreductase [Saccharopolyspora oryzae]|uniref:PDR/VanB family oxidoreductase n=1 Tax=Saccharopolyspora oryzae TaxID=2997343 RepID=A0ABT4UWJ9_9PSEU|nr:PDR/VanB family oxidoreductase [Saccharopolyspora oryzae]MDA3626092.1 PDR/VanB family oxidoreductase [Saccharopolyspora oryzae]
MADTWTTLEVESAEPCATDVVVITLVDPDGAALPAWAPGAHIDVDLGAGFLRQYSLCGDPGDPGRWRIAVLREAAGRGGSQRVHDLVRAGGKLPVRGPRNHFPLVDADRYLFIAGGIGITPILPMVRRAAAQGRPWTALYGGRSRNSMAFVDELRAVPGGDLAVVPQDEFGLLDLPAALGAPTERTAIYCCGPEPLIAAVERESAHWSPGALHRERFTAAPVTTEGGAFEVVLQRSGLRLEVPEHESLLDIIENAGVAVENSCRAGICGTCLVRVTSGEPDHHDDVLSDDERERGEVMLPCVSRARGELLVLDL